MDRAGHDLLRPGGSQNRLKEVLEGEYKGLGTVILRNVDLQTLPLQFAPLLENRCRFISDRDRQKGRAPQP